MKDSVSMLIMLATLMFVLSLVLIYGRAFFQKADGAATAYSTVALVNQNTISYASLIEELNAEGTDSSTEVSGRTVLRVIMKFEDKISISVKNSSGDPITDVSTIGYSDKFSISVDKVTGEDGKQYVKKIYFRAE